MTSQGKGRTTLIGFRVRDSQLKVLDVLSRQKGVSRTQLLSSAVAAYISANPAAPESPTTATSLSPERQALQFRIHGHPGHPAWTPEDYINSGYTESAMLADDKVYLKAIMALRAHHGFPVLKTK